ncbi:hypothetical protein Plhal304r1_c017g0062191 [Plasmopara halstedii]
MADNGRHSMLWGTSADLIIVAQARDFSASALRLEDSNRYSSILVAFDDATTTPKTTEEPFGLLFQRVDHLSGLSTKFELMSSRVKMLSTSSRSRSKIN